MVSTSVHLTKKGWFLKRCAEPPLEAKKPPWVHRPATEGTCYSAVDQQAMAERREELARVTFKAERKARQEHIVQAKVIEPVANLQAPAGLGMKSLGEMRQQLKNKINAMPRTVRIAGTTPGTVYLVCENSYDRAVGTVEVFCTSDPAQSKQRVQWTNCKNPW